VPSLSDWSKNKQQLLELYDQLEDPFQLKYSTYAYISSEKALQETQIIAEQITHLQAKIPFDTFDEFIQLKRNLSFAQIIENEIVKQYHLIFYKSDIQEKFSKYATIYKEKIFLLEQAQKNLHHWKIIPSEEQVAHWEQALKNGSWFTKRKVKKQIIRQLLDPTLDIQKILTSVKKFHTIESNVKKYSLYLLRMGIESPNTELPQIEWLLNHWKNQSQSEFTKILHWSSDQRQFLISQGAVVNQLLEWIEKFVIHDEKDIVNKVFNHLLKHIENNLKFSCTVSKIPQNWYSPWMECSSFETLQLRVLKHYQVQLETYFPMLASYSNEVLLEKIEAIQLTEAIEQETFVEQIIEKQAKKFHHYHQLLLRDSKKLNPEEKELKNKLKNGKRLLVQLFSKSRPRISMRELIQSDAWIWMKVLHPCWMIKPEQVATFFPLNQDIFDALIIDEGSQLPVIETLGALQRSKRTIICGDSKQMSPTYYFSKRNEQVDILHHASYYFSTLKLKHHYRSQHPALIEFSNKHFYQGELKTFPSANQTSYPLHYHFVENGRFIHRTNEKEAVAVAQKIELSMDQITSIGVVAFSKEQLDAIWKACSVRVQTYIMDQMETGKGFFKPLEQVQGEECDVLFISMGYAKNEHDHFQLRMGPLNRLNGYRRLNVLFTRARTNIHFFTSVKAADFPWTDNESMNLLRWYIEQIELDHNNSHIYFPYLFDYQIDENKISIPSIYKQISNQNELVTTISVLKSRGWKIY